MPKVKHPFRIRKTTSDERGLCDYKALHVVAEIWSERSHISAAELKKEFYGRYPYSKVYVEDIRFVEVSTTGGRERDVKRLPAVYIKAKLNNEYLVVKDEGAGVFELYASQLWSGRREASVVSSRGVNRYYPTFYEWGVVEPKQRR